MSVAVNLSPAQFADNSLVPQLRDLLTTRGLAPERLELEVTEGLLLNDEESVAEQLAGLRAMGVSIAMDDFGTGYSSLGYLWKYRFDKLKVDRVFLEGYDFDPRKYREIIETIVVLGHKMGMTVTVEGVEKENHADLLKEIDCDQIQGFLFGSPMTAEDAAALVKASQGAARKSA